MGKKKEGVVAYIAGIIDGEGCITICRRKIKRLKTGNWYYEPQVIISNTYRGLLDFCVEYYGGWIATLRKCKREHTTAYQWKTTGDEMRSLLKDVLPYLIVKKRQARVVLSFPRYNGNGQKCRTEREKKEQENLWFGIKKLNRGLSDDEERKSRDCGGEEGSET